MRGNHIIHVEEFIIFSVRRSTKPNSDTIIQNKDPSTDKKSETVKLIGSIDCHRYTFLACLLVKKQRFAMFGKP